MQETSSMVLDGIMWLPCPRRAPPSPFVSSTMTRVRFLFFCLQFSLFSGLLQPVRCSLRIETCSNCVLNFKYHPPSPELSDEEIRLVSDGLHLPFSARVPLFDAAGVVVIIISRLSRSPLKVKKGTAGCFLRGFNSCFQMSACQESLLDPCFDLRFVEEKADTTLDLIYQKISIWDEPTR